MCSTALLSHLDLECARRMRHPIPDSYNITPTSQIHLQPHSLPVLPPELWLTIFRHATSLDRFFDSKWYNGILDSFDDANGKDVYDAFAKSLQVRKAISLVCRSWNQLGSHLLYAHLVIRRQSQLRPLVHMLERSHHEALANGHSAGMGWWITHIKLLAIDYESFRVRPSPSSLTELESHDIDNKSDIHSPVGTVAQYVRRLLRCCPQLQVLLDAAPYGPNQRPSSILSVLSIASSLEESQSTTTGSSSTSSTSQSQLRSLEWNYGGPAVDDLIANAKIVNNLRSLRCFTIHESAAAATEEITQEQLLPDSVHPPILVSLPFAKLVSLDLWISRENHTHLSLLSSSDLPSLTHFTIRSSSPSGIALGPEPLLSLQSFFAIHGPKLRNLDLRLCPGESPPPILLPGEDAEQGIVNVPTILAQCPNLTDLILSARWFALHTSLYNVPHFLTGTIPTTNNNNNPTTTTTHHTSPFSTTSRHLNLERIGLRDTSSRADGYSQAISEMPCISCSRPSLMNVLTDPGRGEYAGQRGSFTSTTTSFRNETVTQLLLMSHRHCTIDRHLRMILSGFKPMSVLEEEFGYGSGSGYSLPPYLVGRREALMKEVERGKRFPSLKSIHLLDSQPDMFELGGGGGGGGVGHGRCSSWRTCWCTPRVMRIETSFWAAWAVRCVERGVSLLDRHGNGVTVGPSLSSSSSSSSGSGSGSSSLGGGVESEEDVVDKRLREDLDEELRISLEHCYRGRGVERSLYGSLELVLGVKEMSIWAVLNWLLHKGGLFGMTRSFIDIFWLSLEIFIHVWKTPL